MVIKDKGREKKQKKISKKGVNVKETRVNGQAQGILKRIRIANLKERQIMDREKKIEENPMNPPEK